MSRILLFTLVVVVAVAGVHPADSVEARVRSVSDRFAAKDVVLDRAHDRPSTMRAIRELNHFHSIPGLQRAYGDRVLQEAPAGERARAEWAVAEARQRLGRRLTKWVDDGWLTETDLCRLSFLRLVTATFHHDVERNCEVIAIESYDAFRRGMFCDWPGEEELYRMLTTKHETADRSLLRPDQFLNPWGGRVSITVVETAMGPKPVAFATVWGESGWERVLYPQGFDLK